MVLCNLRLAESLQVCFFAPQWPQKLNLFGFPPTEQLPHFHSLSSPQSPQKSAPAFMTSLHAQVQSFFSSLGSLQSANCLSLQPREAALRKAALEASGFEAGSLKETLPLRILLGCVGLASTFCVPCRTSLAVSFLGGSSRSGMGACKRAATSCIDGARSSAPRIL